MLKEQIAKSKTSWASNMKYLICPEKSIIKCKVSIAIKKFHLMFLKYKQTQRAQKMSMRQIIPRTHLQIILTSQK